MPRFDEATLRKAAAWQDFKEAQGLVNTGAVQESEETKEGWRGSVRVGTRTYRVTVAARTPTWLDANCPCPANRREGSFCPHAIAVGLHLFNPPTTPVAPEKKTLSTLPAAAVLPELSWHIRFQGPWRKTLANGRASVAIVPSTHAPEDADERLTAWLISQKATSSTTLQLALDSRTLSKFLEAIQNHPEVHTTDSRITIDTNARLTLEDCFVQAGTVILRPAHSQIFSIGASSWKIGTDTLSKIVLPSSSDPAMRTVLGLTEGNSITLSVQDFLDQLEALQESMDFSSSAWFERLHFIPETPVVELELMGSPSSINLKVFTSYSQAIPRLEEDTIYTSDPQSVEKTLKLATSVLSGLFDSSTIRSTNSISGKISSSEAVELLFTKTLKLLPSSWKVSLSQRLKEFADTFVFISPKIRLVGSTEDSNEFTLTYEASDGQTISPAKIRSLLDSNRSLRSNDGLKNFILSDDIENLIDPLFGDLDLRQENGRFIAKGASMDVIEEISKKIHNSFNTNDGEEGVTPETYSEVPKISATLRPYQIKGFIWLIDRLSRYQGALLSDDMGLGKTLQTIACIQYLHESDLESGPVLIVVTTSLLGNWLSEIERFTPGRKIITLHGPLRDRLRERVSNDCIILTTYSTLARDLAWHLKQKYSLAVIDEASLIRNPDTDHSKAVSKLHADRRIALTGTPVENSARDLWSIFRFIQPGWLGSKSDFHERYEQPLKSPETAAKASLLLKLKTSPFVLRRTKQEVAPELPSKILIDEYCALSKDQLSLYHELQKEGLRKIGETRDSGQVGAARMQTLTLLLRLRQACCDLALLDSEKLAKLSLPRRSGKLERLLEIIEQAIASESRILVFSQFQKQLVEIETVLSSLGILSLRLDGKSRNRQDLVNRFQSEDGPPVFLISLKAGGYGLNLTAADVVVHFDPWWNPAAEAQATDRAHRIGQTKPVTVYRLLTRGTVEEKVVELQRSKRALADSLDESATPTDAPAWTISELKSLLG